MYTSKEEFEFGDLNGVHWKSNSLKSLVGMLCTEIKVESMMGAFHTPGGGIDAETLHELKVPEGHYTFFVIHQTAKYAIRHESGVYEQGEVEINPVLHGVN